MADTGSAIYTLAIVNRQLRLMSVVDNDGEVFEVRKSGWAGGHFTIDYHVPSTGYDVTITLIEQVREGVWMTYWVNAYDNGNEEWTKVD